MLDGVKDFFRKETMEDHLFNLTFTARTLIKESQKSEKQALQQKKKCKVAMEKNNTEGARIYAENAIREKNNAINLLRLSSRIDSVAARVNTAVKLNQVTKNMGGIVKSMGSVMKSMDPAKIMQVMDQFEKQFEDLDVTSKVMETSMQNNSAQAMPESEVDNLMKEVADEHGLDFQSSLEENQPVRNKKQQEALEAKEEEAKLEERFKRLQGL